MLKWHVKELIETRKMSMRQLARKAEVSYRTIRRICQNPFDCRRVPASTWVKLAKTLEVPLSAILQSVSSSDQQAQVSEHDVVTPLVGSGPFPDPHKGGHYISHTPDTHIVTGR